MEKRIPVIQSAVTRMWLFPVFFATLSFVLSGCVEDPKEYPAPVILSPENNKTFYPDQRISIRWSVPDSTQTVDMQALMSHDPDFFADGRVLFDTLNQRRADQFTNQTSYSFSWQSELNRKIYAGFRLRYRTPDGVSPWSEIRYYTVAPYSDLEVKYVDIFGDFSFAAKETGKYYSDFVMSTNEVDLTNELVKKGYDLTKLEFIKPNTGTIVDNGAHASDLERMAFGFNKPTDVTFPFDVWGDVYGIGTNDAVTFYPFGGIYRNIYNEIGNKKLKMSAVYFLSQFKEGSEMLGLQHDVRISVNLKCYFRK